MLVATALSGCESGSDGPSTSAGQRVSPDAPGTPERSTPPRLVVDGPSRGVPVDRLVSLQVEGGALRSLVVTSPRGRLAGSLSADGRRWVATERLEPGTTYAAVGQVESSDDVRRVRTRFSTEHLSLDQQTFPSIAPLTGETVGVGMPVIVTFDLPVSDRALFERHMSVTSQPSQEGSWHWLDDREVHWRARTYWRPGTSVRVDVDVNGLPAGNGIYGQDSRVVDFRVGDSVVSKVDVASHRMDVFVNGDLARSMPISAGKPGWETRSGTKVIIEKFRRKRMSAATIGVSEDDPEFYDLSNVEYALRVTYSGEFLHAAPWSSGSQGSANVSHGCVGMSTSDAAWLYGITRRGDVVEVTGSSRSMTLENGFGDWNASFAEYRQGSALS